MATIYKNGDFVEETWTSFDTEAGAPDTGNIIAPMKAFLADTDGFLAREDNFALLVEVGDNVDELEPYLARLNLIAVDFPSFADGRGFSAARVLREQFSYEGDIRAVGKYILDQVPLARRCGFSSFEISKPEVLKALKAGEWPEVTKYLQPVGTVDEIPVGSRPWARRSPRDIAVAAE